MRNEDSLDSVGKKVRARKEGATDDDIVDLLSSNLNGPSYENYNCGGTSTIANASHVTVASNNCYAQVSKC